MFIIESIPCSKYCNGKLIMADIFAKAKIIGKYNSIYDAEKAKLDYICNQRNNFECELVHNAYYPYDTHLQYDNGEIERIYITYY